MADTLRITILEDGTIKTETDQVSGANHSSAEGFLNTLTQLGGAPGVRTRKGHAHAHSHEPAEVSK